MKKKIFVSGATGFQGTNVARLFLAEGHHVTTLSSSKEGSSNQDGLQLIPGGFEDKIALSKALEGVQIAVYTFPLIFDQEKAKEYTTNFIEAAESQNVSLVIYNASFDLPKEETGLLALDLKLVIHSLFEKSKLKVTTLVPDIYIDNLAAPWSIPVILEKGILPYPIASGKKIPWISHVDLAKFIVAAAQKPDLAGSILPIGGNRFSGEEVADAIAQHIGKPVNFVGLSPNDFEQQLIPAFGDLAAKEISNIYRYVEQHREQMVAKDFEHSAHLLSVSSQSLKDWVGSVDWKG